MRKSISLSAAVIYRYISRLRILQMRRRLRERFITDESRAAIHYIFFLWMLLVNIIYCGLDVGRRAVVVIVRLARNSALLTFVPARACLLHPSSLDIFILRVYLFYLKGAGSRHRRR